MGMGHGSIRIGTWKHQNWDMEASDISLILLLSLGPLTLYFALKRRLEKFFTKKFIYTIYKLELKIKKI
jgi:hypothetical protein